MLITIRPGALERLRGDLTQRELAERAEVSRATINRIEGGHAESITFSTVNKLARALDVDADVLVSFERER